MLKRTPEGEPKQAQETQHEWPQSIALGHRMQLRSRATFLILQSIRIGVHAEHETANHESEGGTGRPFAFLRLLRRQFFGFTLSTHQLERALGFFISLRNLFLHFGCCFFHLWRETHVAVVLHTGAGWDQSSHDDVLLQTAQVIYRALNRCLGEHAGGLLERGRRDERFSRKRCFRDPQQQWPSRRWFAALGNDTLVLFAEAELVHLLLQQELSVADVFDFHPTHHLPHDHFDVLIADVHTLQPIDFLDFVHQVSLQLLLAQYGKDVMRIERTIHQRFASPDAFALLHIDVNAARY